MHTRHTEKLYYYFKRQNRFHFPMFFTTSSTTPVAGALSSGREAAEHKR